MNDGVAKESSLNDSGGLVESIGQDFREQRFFANRETESEPFPRAGFQGNTQFSGCSRTLAGAGEALGASQKATMKGANPKRQAVDSMARNARPTRSALPCPAGCKPADQRLDVCCFHVCLG
jgi:hypothetical protein